MYHSGDYDHSMLDGLIGKYEFALERPLAECHGAFLSSPSHRIGQYSTCYRAEGLSVQTPMLVVFQMPFASTKRLPLISMRAAALCNVRSRVLPLQSQNKARGDCCIPSCSGPSGCGSSCGVQHCSVV